MTMRENMARAVHAGFIRRCRARTVFKANWDEMEKFAQEYWLRFADDALDALNHPTQAVLNAGGEICANDADELDTGMAAECLNAMICAIKDGK